MFARRLELAVGGAAISIGCLLVSRTWPPAAAVAFAGVLVAFFGTMAFNTPVTRAAYWVACSAHAIALGLATGSPYVAACAALATAPLVGTEWAVRVAGYKFLKASTVTAGLAWLAFALAWPLGAWAWALAIPLVLATLLSVSALDMLRGMRRLGHPAWNVKVGAMVPDFTLSDRSGKPAFTLSNERGHGVLLAFVRGDWCPVCHMQLRIYQREAANLAQHNVKVVVASTSTGDAAVSFAHDLGVDVPLLADPECEVAEIFGAVELHGHDGKKTATPSAFLIGPDGRLLHSSPPADVATFLDPRKVPPLLEYPALAPAS
jgi:peroxiredoxin